MGGGDTRSVSGKKRANVALPWRINWDFLDRKSMIIRAPWIFKIPKLKRDQPYEQTYESGSDVHERAMTKYSVISLHQTKSVTRLHEGHRC